MKCRLTCCLDLLDVTEAICNEYVCEVWDADACPKEVMALIPEKEKQRLTDRGEMVGWVVLTASMEGPSIEEAIESLKERRKELEKKAEAQRITDLETAMEALTERTVLMKIELEAEIENLRVRVEKLERQK